MASNSPSFELSVVIPTLNEGSRLRRTVEQFQASLSPESEILVVDDGSTDGSADFISGNDPRIRRLKTSQAGCARARNFGARQAGGEVIVFADAHLEVPAGWWPPVRKALDHPSVGAVSPAISVIGRSASVGYGMKVTGPDLSIRWLERRGRQPYAIPILSGAFLAMRREVFEETGGFDEGLIRWGANDLELSLRLWLLGYEQRLVPQVVVGHLFRPKHPYAVAWQAILHNLLRVTFIHFNPARIERVVAALKNHPAFARALAMFPESDALNRRARFGGLRVHNDDWFFNSFGIVC